MCSIWKNPEIPEILVENDGKEYFSLVVNGLCQWYIYQGTSQDFYPVLALATSKIRKVSLFIGVLKVLLSLFLTIIISAAVQSLLFLDYLFLFIYWFLITFTVFAIRLSGTLYIYIMKKYAVSLENQLSNASPHISIKVSGYCKRITLFPISPHRTYHIFQSGQIVHSGYTSF